MQADYGNGIYGEVEPHNEEKLKKLLEEGAESVMVFKNDSKEFRNAKTRRKTSVIKFNNMTKNQKKRLRKKGYDF